MLKINLNNYNIEDVYIVVGVSSGPDSMALLHLMCKNTKKKIICAHINHNIRKESDIEEKYLNDYCIKNNIIFESTKINNYTENNFENEARKKRYAFYKKVLNKYNTKYLFLAHHGDDLIETILMKIIRGSSLEGYAGIKEINNLDNYCIIRPLLQYTKKDLIEYCNKYNIKYYIDKTNQDNNYTRNRIRNKLLPLLKEEDNNINDKFLKYSKTLLEYNNYIESNVKKILDTSFKDNILNLKEFVNIDLFMKKNIIFEILAKIYNNQDNIIKEKHIISIIDIINNKKPNITLNLPKNIIVIKEYNKLIFEKQCENKKEYKNELKDYNIINNHIIQKIDKTNESGNDIIKLNSKKISLPLYIRNKKNGDIIKVKGLNGSKKIKDIFIEKKIPLAKRKSYPILVDNKDTVLWIPNLKKSIFDECNNEKYDIILKYCEKEDFNEK